MKLLLQLLSDCAQAEKPCGLLKVIYFCAAQPSVTHFVAVSHLVLGAVLLLFGAGRCRILTPAEVGAPGGTRAVSGLGSVLWSCGARRCVRERGASSVRFWRQFHPTRDKKRAEAKERIKNRFFGSIL